MKAGNPERLIVLATVLGGEATERALHRQFKDIRYGKSREWFHPTKELHAFLAPLIAKAEAKSAPTRR